MTTDTNCGWGFWPLQRFPWNNVREFEKSLAETGIDEAWVSAIESICFPETETFDLRLARQLPEFPRLRFVKTVNPLLALWKKEFVSFQGEEMCPVAIKVFPNYHDYAVERLGGVAEFAAEHHLPVLVPVRVNDERNQPVFMQVPPVKVDEVLALASRHRETVFLIQNAQNSELRVLKDSAPNVLCDAAFVDGYDCIKEVGEMIGGHRLVFGSHAPFLYPLAAEWKVSRTTLPGADRIRSENLERLIKQAQA